LSKKGSEAGGERIKVKGISKPEVGMRNAEKKKWEKAERLKVWGFASGYDPTRRVQRFGASVSAM